MTDGVDIFRKMWGLDLFSGIGGLTLALDEWVRPIAYCENNSYCQAVLLSRMASGRLGLAPIWDDIKTLQWHGRPIDIIYGGFPCQGISVAGLGRGLADVRTGLFFEIVRLCRDIAPKFVFLENVPAICSRGGTEVVREITEMGYDCRWGIIPATAAGAIHKRERWFLLAHHPGKRIQGFPSEPFPWESKLSGSEDVRGFEEFTRRSHLHTPKLCGGGNGISFELDCLIFICEGMDEQGGKKIYDAKEITEINLFNREILRNMWKYREIAKTSPELYIRKLQDLLPNVSQKRAFKGKVLGKRIQKGSKLYNLWKSFYSSSKRSKQIMRQYRLLESLWKIKCKEKMEKEYRIARTHALGNGVVPAQAKEAFKILMGIRGR